MDNSADDKSQSLLGLLKGRFYLPEKLKWDSQQEQLFVAYVENIFLFTKSCPTDKESLLTSNSLLPFLRCVITVMFLFVDLSA